MTLAQILADFASAPVSRNDTMAQFVRFSLLDWASVGIAGRAEPVAQASRQLALAEGIEQATLFGGGKGSARTVAMANGAISHALDYDDTHFGYVGHPSVAIIPAALAMAEREGGSGARFLDAITVGMEVVCRIGTWLGRTHYDAGFHQTGTSGAFGATAAAGRVLRLDAPAMAHALALTSTRAAGLKSQFGTMGKPLNAGFAAEVGVTSALLAAGGVTSALDAIEGVQGFGPTHAAAEDHAAFEGLGQEWLFPNVSYKFHACCHGLHAMLEALRTLNLSGPVTSVSIETHPRWLKVCNQPSPTTGLAAKFSYRLTAAMMLSGVDTAALESYTDEVCALPDLIALRDKVEVRGNDTLEDTEAQVTVVAGGQTHQARSNLMEATDIARIGDRLNAKSTSLLGDALARDLQHDLSVLEEARDLSAFTTRIATI
ncbi:MmgE/PrpD family protein [Pontivivens nitratireducens]|uniref:MmgE/PrpD family protein n=1 Tax=Pontivivens nitratireducens TaxID=2758038 RepID=A0A6G7VL01_9RHOB|nr:MmgE/PrpD family protein [Pontibrevibacter nitratireducens]QIK40580.1 MmgE/PrpD family protein [Pontibrevibacter nitratireducens]